jgi:hypothetical protein
MSRDIEIGALQANLRPGPAFEEVDAVSGSGQDEQLRECPTLCVGMTERSVMSTKAKTDHELIETVGVDSAGGVRSEPGGRAQRPAGAARLLEGVSPVDMLPEVRDRLSD